MQLNVALRDWVPFPRNTELCIGLKQQCGRQWPRANRTFRFDISSYCALIVARCALIASTNAADVFEEHFLLHTLDVLPVKVGLLDNIGYGVIRAEAHLL